MEKKVITVNSKSKVYEIKENSIFLWVLEHEEGINSYKTRLTLAREDNAPYHQELVTLEKKFHKVSPIPMWAIIALGICAFGFFTAFLLLYIVKGKKLDMFTEFLSTILPALVFTLLTGVLGLLRTKHSLKYLQKSSSRFEEYQKEVQGLLDKYQKENVD